MKHTFNGIAPQSLCLCGVNHQGLHSINAFVISINVLDKLDQPVAVSSPWPLDCSHTFLSSATDSCSSFTDCLQLALSSARLCRLSDSVIRRTHVTENVGVSTGFHRICYSGLAARRYAI